jgi:hypothetical protein
MLSAILAYRTLSNVSSEITIHEYKNELWAAAVTNSHILVDMSTIGLNADMYATCASHYIDVVEKSIVKFTHLHLNMLTVSDLDKKVIALFKEMKIDYEAKNLESQINSIEESPENTTRIIDIRATIRAINNKSKFHLQMCEDAATLIYHSKFLHYEVRSWNPIIARQSINRDSITKSLGKVAHYDVTALSLLSFTGECYYTVLKDSFDIERIYERLDTALGKLFLVVSITLSLMFLVERKLILIIYFILLFLSSPALIVRLILAFLITAIHMVNYPSNRAKEGLSM